MSHGPDPAACAAVPVAVSTPAVARASAENRMNSRLTRPTKRKRPRTPIAQHFRSHNLRVFLHVRGYTEACSATDRPSIIKINQPCTEKAATGRRHRQPRRATALTRVATRPPHPAATRQLSGDLTSQVAVYPQPADAEGNDGPDQPAQPGCPHGVDGALGEALAGVDGPIGGEHPGAKRAADERQN